MQSSQMLSSVHLVGFEHANVFLFLDRIDRLYSLEFVVCKLAIYKREHYYPFKIRLIVVMRLHVSFFVVCVLNIECSQL